MPDNGFEMMIHRRLMSSVVLNESKLGMTGGWSNNRIVNSTEIVSLEQLSVPGPDLPFTVEHGIILWCL